MVGETLGSAPASGSGSACRRQPGDSKSKTAKPPAKRGHFQSKLCTHSAGNGSDPRLVTHGRAGARTLATTRFCNGIPMTFQRRRRRDMYPPDRSSTGRACRSRSSRPCQAVRNLYRCSSDYEVNNLALRWQYWHCNSLHRILVGIQISLGSFCHLMGQLIALRIQTPATKPIEHS